MQIVLSVAPLHFSAHDNWHEGQHDCFGNFISLALAPVSYFANSIINGIIAVLSLRQLRSGATRLVLSCYAIDINISITCHWHWCWYHVMSFHLCQCYVMWKALSMAPLHFFCQDDHIFGHVTPLAPAIELHYANSVVKSTIVFLRSRKLKWGTTCVFFLVNWCHWHWHWHWTSITFWKQHHQWHHCILYIQPPGIRCNITLSHDTTGGDISVTWHQWCHQCQHCISFKSMMIKMRCNMTIWLLTPQMLQLALHDYIVNATIAHLKSRSLKWDAAWLLVMWPKIKSKSRPHATALQVKKTHQTTTFIFHAIAIYMPTTCLPSNAIDMPHMPIGSCVNETTISVYMLCMNPM